MKIRVKQSSTSLSKKVPGYSGLRPLADLKAKDNVVEE
jgi:hypothetical protein